MGDIVRSKITIFEMMKERGFHDVVEDNEKNMHFTNKHGEHLQVKFCDKSSGKILSFENMIENDINLKDIKKKYKDVNIYVVPFDIPLDSTLYHSIRKMYNMKGIFIQFFSYENLYFNVTKHLLVPKHEIIDEIQCGLHEYMKIKDLPKIFISDPVAKFIGLRPNQVCKIHRPSGFYYRLCS